MRDRRRLRRRLVAAAVLVGLVDLVALGIERAHPARGNGSARGGADPAARNGAAPGVVDRERAASAAPVTSSVAAVRPPPPPDIAADPDALRVRRLERVSRALELLRYPPDSQPLDPSMIDVLHPGARHETPLPLAGERSFLFTADTYAVAPGRPVVATLEVFRGRTAFDRRHVPVAIRAAGLARFAQPSYRPVAAAVRLNDEGRDGDASAGDGVYSSAFVPSALPDLAAHNGLIRLDVDFVVEGEDAPAHASIDFRMTSAAPAAFLGVAAERLTADGLEITVELRVQRAGRYVVQALLFDARDRPVGVAVARPLLEQGRALVPLLYWGLLFHEATATAPFTCRTLTGHRLPDPGEPDGTDLTTWDVGYRTHAYAPSDFSTKEHESAAKSRKVQALSDLAATPVQ